MTNSYIKEPYYSNSAVDPLYTKSKAYYLTNNKKSFSNLSYPDDVLFRPLSNNSLTEPPSLCNTPTTFRSRSNSIEPYYGNGGSSRKQSIHLRSELIDRDNDLLFPHNFVYDDFNYNHLIAGENEEAILSDQEENEDDEIDSELEDYQVHLLNFLLKKSKAISPPRSSSVFISDNFDAYVHSSSSDDLIDKSKKLAPKLKKVFSNGFVDDDVDYSKLLTLTKSDYPNVIMNEKSRRTSLLTEVPSYTKKNATDAFDGIIMPKIDIRDDFDNLNSYNFFL